MSDRPALRVTTDYKLFHRSLDNRPVDIEKRKVLRASIERHGFIPAYPLHCVRLGNGDIMLKDGQHRLAIAQELGISVYFVVCEDDAKTSDLATTFKFWKLRDFAGAFHQQGKQDYAELLEFSRTTGIPLSDSIALLQGRSGSSGNTLALYKAGNFKVNERAMANRVATVVVGANRISPKIGQSLFIQAVALVLELKDFDDDRLAEAFEKHPERLIRYGSREGYLNMIEELYNWGRQKKRAVLFEATQLARSRSGHDNDKSDSR